MPGVFNASIFNDAIFNTASVAPENTIVPAGSPIVGRSTKRRRKVMIGERLYEVESLKDVEFLLKRLIREDVEPVVEAAKASIRIVDRVSAKVERAAPVVLPEASAVVDWSPLWNQLAMQDRAYAEALERVLARQEEDDIETLLLLH